MRLPDERERLLAPRARLAIASRENPALAQQCGDILGGGEPQDVLHWLGSDAYATWGHSFWYRVWALRGLLYVWDEQVGPPVVAALGDDAWRVREMAAKVVRLRELPGAHLLEPLVSDPLPRVRVAGLRALAVVGEAEHADAVVGALDDGDAAVERAAAAALARMEVRLDRTL